MCADYWALPVASFGRAVISRIGSKQEITMKTLTLAAIRCSLMFTAVTASLFSVQLAQAYSVTLEQVGSNVVATGSGPINLTGLTFQGSVSTNGVGVLPLFGIIFTGPTGSVNVSQYAGFTGP